MIRNDTYSKNLLWDKESNSRVQMYVVLAIIKEDKTEEELGKVEENIKEELYREWKETY